MERKKTFWKRAILLSAIPVLVATCGIFALMPQQKQEALELARSRPASAEQIREKMGPAMKRANIFASLGFLGVISLGFSVRRYVGLTHGRRLRVTRVQAPAVKKDEARN